MKTALVYIRGLNTHADSDWCGIRSFLESLATLLGGGGADLIGLDYDDEDGIAALDARLTDYDVIHAAGHSHGAAALYDWLTHTAHQVQVAAFLDLCPPWNPTAWMGPAWDAPAYAQKVLVFYQRNDIPLAGVRLAGVNVQECNVTPWGLHHSSMCGDARVQDRIALAMLWQRAGVVTRAAVAASGG
jgi:hypothetical protein